MKARNKLHIFAHNEMRTHTHYIQLLGTYKNTSWWIPVLLFAVGGSLLFHLYQYQVNPDGISYLSIAHQYTTGSFHSALNAYWGPLLSWLVIPLLVFGMYPVVAIKLLGLIIGALFIQALWKCAVLSGTGIRWATFVSCAVIPFIWQCVFTITTPDLLLALLLCYVFLITSSLIHEPTLPKSVLLGLLAGLCFLTKAYALPLLIIWFLTLVIYQRHTIPYKSLARPLLISIAIFCIILVSWSCALYSKYGKIIISSTGQFNFNILGPRSSGYPMHYVGFINPPSPSAASSWDDPTLLPTNSWRGASFSNAEFFFSNILVKNVLKTVQVFKHYPIVALLLLLIPLLGKSRKGKTRSVFLLSALGALNACGYMLILVEERYLWFTVLVSAMVPYALIQQLELRKSIKRSVLGITTTLLIVSMIYPVRNLQKDRYTGKYFLNLAQTMRAENIPGPVASDSSWHNSLYLSYFMGEPYFGEAAQAYPDQTQLISALTQKHIRTYLTWNTLETSDIQRLTSAGFTQHPELSTPFGVWVRK